MTAPALGLETPEQKAARLAAEQKQSALTAPALSLAGQADAAAKTAGAQAIAGPAAPTDKLTTTISAPKTGPQDRIALAQSAWDTSTAQSAPAYEASLRAAKQAAAGVGQLGSGMLRTTLGDLALTRQRDMDAERSALLNNAITGSIADNQFATGVDQQQQQFQSTEDARRFQQALDSQKVGLDTTLGLADVAIKQKQADTNAQSVSGGLELQRAELVAKYGAAEADRMIEQQKVDAQKTQFGQSLQEQQATRMQQYGISQQDINLKAQQLQQEAALQGRSLTIQEAQNQAQNALEQAKITQSGTQFQAQMTLEQKKAELDDLVQKGQLSIAQSNQQLADWQTKNAAQLEQQKVTNQMSQFTQAQQQQASQYLSSLSLDQAKLVLEDAVQRGQLSVAQKNQLLSERAQTEQTQVAQAGLTLEGQKVANQATQFAQSQTQQAGQFTAAQQQQMEQFRTTMNLDQMKLALDDLVQKGQLTVAQRNQALQEKTQADTQALQTGQLSLAQKTQADTQALEQARLSLDDRVRSGQLTVEQAAQELEKIKVAQQQSQFTAGQAQQQSQFQSAQAQQAAQFTASMGMDEKKLALDDLVQKGQLSIAERNQILQQNVQTGQLTLAQKTQADEQALNARKVALDEQVRTGQLTVEQAAQQLEKERLAQQASQFSATQAQQQSQFLSQQAQQADQFTKSMNLDEKKLALEDLVQKGQLSVAEKNQLLQSTVQTGQLTLAQKAQGDEQALNIRKQTLDEQVRLGQLTVEQAAQQLEKDKLAQQSGQFTLSLAEQTKSREQELTLQAQRDAAEAARLATSGTQALTLQGAQDAAAAARLATSGTQDIALQAARDAAEAARLGTQGTQALGLQTAENKAEAERQAASIASAEKMGITGAQQLGLAQGQAVGQVYDPSTGTYKTTVESAAAQAQNDLAKNQLWAQLATALGLTPPSNTTSGTVSPGMPQLGAVSKDGAWRWSGTAWVENTGNSTPPPDPNNPPVNCPAPDVLVTMADDSEKEAGDLIVGDFVKAWDEEAEAFCAEIVTEAYPSTNTRAKAILSNGREGLFAVNHKFLTAGGAWVELQHLVAGDELTEGVTLVGVESDGVGPVVKIGVSRVHTFVTLGVVSHNAFKYPPQ